MEVGDENTWFTECLQKKNIILTKIQCKLQAKSGKLEKKIYQVITYSGIFIDIVVATTTILSGVSVILKIQNQVRK